MNAKLVTDMKIDPIKTSIYRVTTTEKLIPLPKYVIDPEGADNDLTWSLAGAPDFVTIKGDNISIKSDKETDSDQYTFNVVLTDSFSSVSKKTTMTVKATCMTDITHKETIENQNYNVDDAKIVIDAAIFA